MLLVIEGRTRDTPHFLESKGIREGSYFILLSVFLRHSHASFLSALLLIEPPISLTPAQQAFDGSFDLAPIYPVHGVNFNTVVAQENLSSGEGTAGLESNRRITASNANR